MEYSYLQVPFIYPASRRKSIFWMGGGFPPKFYFRFPPPKTDMENFFVPYDVVYPVEHSKMRKDAPSLRNRKKQKITRQGFFDLLSKEFSFN